MAVVVSGVVFVSFAALMSALQGRTEWFSTVLLVRWSFLSSLFFVCTSSRFESFSPLSLSSFFLFAGLLSLDRLVFPNDARARVLATIGFSFRLR